MMKEILFATVMTALLMSGCGPDPVELIKNQMEVVERAKEYKDYSTAIAAMHQVIQLDPNRHTFLDSLASLYFDSGQMESAYLTSAKAMTYQVLPQTLRIASASARATGRHEEALGYAQRLEESNPADVSVKFNIGLDYANIGDIAAAVSYFQKVTQHPKAGSTNFVQYMNSSSQTVSYLAAAHNALGYIYMQQGELQMAQDEFKLALEANSEYKLAINNLKLLIEIAEKQKQ